VFVSRVCCEPSLFITKISLLLLLMRLTKAILPLARNIGDWAKLTVINRKADKQTAENICRRF
jgi:hypothetical protein